jgi:hypothetical protein
MAHERCLIGCYSMNQSVFGNIVRGFSLALHLDSVGEGFCYKNLEVTP